MFRPIIATLMFMPLLFSAERESILGTAKPGDWGEYSFSIADELGRPRAEGTFTFTVLPPDRGITKLKMTLLYKANGEPKEKTQSPSFYLLNSKFERKDVSEGTETLTIDGKACAAKWMKCSELDHSTSAFTGALDYELETKIWRVEGMPFGGGVKYELRYLSVRSERDYPRSPAPKGYGPKVELNYTLRYELLKVGTASTPAPRPTFRAFTRTGPELEKTALPAPHAGDWVELSISDFCRFRTERKKVLDVSKDSVTVEENTEQDDGTKKTSKETIKLAELAEHLGIDTAEMAAESPEVFVDKGTEKLTINGKEYDTHWVKVSYLTGPRFNAMWTKVWKAKDVPFGGVVRTDAYVWGGIMRTEVTNFGVEK